MKDQTLKARVFGTVALNSHALELNGEKFTPDDTKAYAAFTLARGFPVVTAYGTCVHPGTVGNSFQSMKHQVVNYDHQMKANDGSKEKDQIRHDRNIGAVVGVEFPRAPHGGWKMGGDKQAAPAINGVMVIHKRADKVQQVLGEYLTGRHKWTVSMEMQYGFLGSGFVVGDAAKGNQAQRALMEEQTPGDLNALGLGYVAVDSAPEELVNCFNFEKRRIVGAWNGLPVSLMQGGLNGDVHFAGLGIVRYGAEREAEIQQILASDPDRLEDFTGKDFFTPAAQFHLAGVAGIEKMAEAVAALLQKK